MISAGLGALLRAALQRIAHCSVWFINAISAILIGLLFALAHRYNWSLSDAWQWWLGVGFLGGFSTVSSQVREVWDKSESWVMTSYGLFWRLGCGVLLALMSYHLIDKWTSL